MRYQSMHFEEPIDIAHGKQAEDFPEVESPLTPFGPSDIFILGISFFSIVLVYQELKPLSLKEKLFHLELMYLQSDLYFSCINLNSFVDKTHS